MRAAIDWPGVIKVVASDNMFRASLVAIAFGLVALTWWLVDWGYGLSSLDALVYQVALFTFGLASVVAVIQVIALNRALEFGRMSETRFLNELDFVLGKAGPSRREEAAELHYFCQVHEPTLPITGGSPAFVEFADDFRKVLADPTVKKHIAIMDPWAEDPTVGEPVPELRVGSPLATFIVDWANQYYYPEAKCRLVMKEEPSALPYPESVQQPMDIKDTCVRPDRYFHQARSLFHHLFVDGRVLGDESDKRCDVILYRVSNRDAFKHFNIFFCNGAGLIVFFRMYSDGHYQMEGLSLRHREFLHVLPLLFKTLTLESSAKRVGLRKA